MIYTSDHGDMMFSHNLWAKGPCAYDEITRGSVEYIPLAGNFSAFGHISRHGFYLLMTSFVSFYKFVLYDTTTQGGGCQ